MRATHSKLLLAIFVLTLLLGSCGIVEREEETKGSTSDSTYFQATLNGGETWSGEPRGVFVDNGGKFDHMLSISCDTIHQNNFPYTEELIIFVNFDGKKSTILQGKNMR